MDHNHQTPDVLKKVRQLMYITPVITTILSLLFWTYRTDSTFQDWTKYHQADPITPIQEQLHVPQNRSPGHIVPQKQYLSLVAVNSTKTLLVSAYLEHRGYKKQVRVIAVVLRSEKIPYRCLFYCQEQLLISEGVSNIHADHFGFAYGTADIMCPLPSGCETLTYIAVTSAAAKTSDDLKEAFLEVKNQAKAESFPYDFTVCVSTMFDFTNVMQLVQSLEMLQLLGVNRVAIYMTSCSPETQRILDYYTHKGLVEVIPWSLSKFLNVARVSLPSRGPGDLHYFGQIPALNDCLYRYMYQSRYVAMHDIDELILPQTVNSWVELLPLLEKKYGANKCYMFENNVFPALPLPGSRTPSTQSCWEKVSGVNILSHLYHEPKDEWNWINFKIIVNPRVVFSATVHGVLKSQHCCSQVDRNIARMYHTRAQKQITVTRDQLIFDSRLLNYATNLTSAVTTALRETGLLPEDGIH